MVSTLIVFPPNGATFRLGKKIKIILRSRNIQYGFFEDPNTRYYARPQTLNRFGNIQGHNHITIQKLESLGSPPSAKNPLYFEGLNEVGRRGELRTIISPDLFKETGPGIYRICTMTSSRSHLPVFMPVARRGPQDDCIRINIIL